MHLPAAFLLLQTFISTERLMAQVQPIPAPNFLAAHPEQPALTNIPDRSRLMVFLSAKKGQTVASVRTRWRTLFLFRSSVTRCLHVAIMISRTISPYFQ